MCNPIASNAAKRYANHNSKTSRIAIAAKTTGLTCDHAALIHDGFSVASCPQRQARQGQIATNDEFFHVFSCVNQSGRKSLSWRNRNSGTGSFHWQTAALEMPSTLASSVCEPASLIRSDLVMA
jgi:hypothetical protein